MVLWMVFSFSLLLLWDNWQKAQGRPSMMAGLFGMAPAPDAKSPASGAGAKPVLNDLPTAPQSTNLLPPSDQAPSQGERIIVTTDVLRLTFDTVGAQLVGAELLNYPDADAPGRSTRLFEISAARTYVAQVGVVGVSEAPNHRTPFALVSSATTLPAGQDTLELRFEALRGGLKVSEIYTLKRGHYAIALRQEITNVSAVPVQPSVYLQLSRDGGSAPGASHFYSTFTGPAVYTPEKYYQKVAFGDIEKGSAEHVKNSSAGWVAMVQHYFVSAFVPRSDTPRSIYTKRVSDNLYAIGTLSPLGTLAPAATTTYDSTLYAGPQNERTLEGVAPGLELVRDYGWLRMICKPLFWLLEHLYSLVGNWGWAIVLLTIIVKLAFFPLSATSYRSMARMRKMTPRLTKLREQYGSDKMKLNQAMMELYRTEKINPLGGCLPVIVQIPVFLALYWVLLASVEMRNAPWIGWIRDLTVPEEIFHIKFLFIDMPVGLLPIVMAATMFLQTRLNPMPPDPLQAKVMMLMPLLFSFMFFFFPSGLVLYWVVNNILSIAQQWYITRLFENRSSPAARAG
jgi:YidC/Oxa1 family membrane protein insertase